MRVVMASCVVSAAVAVVDVCAHEKVTQVVCQREALVRLCAV